MVIARYIINAAKCNIGSGNNAVANTVTQQTQKEFSLVVYERELTVVGDLNCKQYLSNGSLFPQFH